MTRQLFPVAAALLVLLPAPRPVEASPGVLEAVVKIYTVHTPPDYDSPWSMHSPRSSTSSGSIVEGGLVLTNAHAVADGTFIEVRRHGMAEKFPATVKAVSHAADLALLEVSSPAFFEGVVPLRLGGLPEIQQEVIVYGFPAGGDTLSSTRGVISRIEHRYYAHSSRTLLAGQLDAAVNPGNSGGPVIAGGVVIGVVMQSLRNADNIGYMVPTPVIRHFLDDLADGSLDGFPVVGFRWQNMESSTLREMYGLSAGERGILLSHVIPGSPADGVVRQGDVLTEVDGKKIAADGTVEIRPGERTSLNYMIQDKQVGERVDLQVLRDGAVESLSVELSVSMGDLDLAPRDQYDRRPSYFIYGGLIFSPLTSNYLKTWGDDWYDSAPKSLVAAYFENLRTVAGEEAVLLIGVLPADVNRGFHDWSDTRMKSVNGRKITNLADLVRICEEEGGPAFTVFETETGYRIALDREEAVRSRQELLDRYRVPADRSEDLPRSGP